MMTGNQIESKVPGVAPFTEVEMSPRRVGTTVCVGSLRGVRQEKKLAHPVNTRWDACVERRSPHGVENSASLQIRVVRNHESPQRCRAKRGRAERKTLEGNNRGIPLKRQEEGMSCVRSILDEAAHRHGFAQDKTKFLEKGIPAGVKRGPG